MPDSSYFTDILQICFNRFLDKQLSYDNQHFYKEVIRMFNDEIKANIKEYNNIADYVEKYNIKL